MANLGSKTLLTDRAATDRYLVTRSGDTESKEITPISLLGGTLKTGTTITFDGNNIYNSSAALTGNPTFDFTGAYIGAKVTVRHNDSVAPTMPGVAVYEGGTYRTSYDNYITFTYVSNSIVLYRFSQQSVTLLDPIVSATNNGLLIVDASGRINQSTEVTFSTPGGGGNTNVFQVGGSAKTDSKFVVKGFPGGINSAFGVTNNGDAYMFRVDMTNKIYTSSDASGYFAPSNTGLATGLSNSARGLVFRSGMGSINGPGFGVDYAPSPGAGATGTWSPGLLVTVTAPLATGVATTVDVKGVVINMAGSSDSFYTGAPIGLDIAHTMTGTANYTPVGIKVRSGRSGFGTGTALPTGMVHVTSPASSTIPTLKLIGTSTTTNYLVDAYQSDGTTRAFGVQDNGDTFIKGSLTITDKDLVLSATTGTKIGTATTQKLSLWNATPIVQPTTAIAASTFAANTSAIANDTATWDGYTIGQIVKALRNLGILA